MIQSREPKQDLQRRMDIKDGSKLRTCGQDDQETGFNVEANHMALRGRGVSRWPSNLSDCII